MTTVGGGALDPLTPEERERWWATLARTVAVDFDGVLHPYTKGWIGSVPDDEPPIEGAREFIIALRDAGYRLVVFSTRCDHAEGLNGVLDWLSRYSLFRYFDEVTSTKPAAVAYVDDRAVPFAGNWADVLIGIAKLAAGPAHGAGASE